MIKRCIVGFIIKWERTKALYNVIKANLGKRFCNIRVSPIVSFILHSNVFTCFSKGNRVSRIIPRFVWVVACITLSLLNIRYYFRFPTENDLLCLFFESRLKPIFH